MSIDQEVLDHVSDVACLLNSIQGSVARERQDRLARNLPVCLSISDVCELLQISESQLRAIRLRGDGPPVLGDSKAPMFPINDFIKWFLARPRCENPIQHQKTLEELGLKQHRSKPAA